MCGRCYELPKADFEEFLVRRGRSSSQTERSVLGSGSTTGTGRRIRLDLIGTDR